MGQRRVAKVTELIAASPVSFDEATRAAFNRAKETLRDITGMKVMEQRVAVNSERIIEYRVKVEVIFIIDG